VKKFDIEKFPKWMQELLKPDVIKSMEIKFVATAMGILIMVFIIMLSSINMIMKTVSQSQSLELLQKIAESDRYNSLNNDMMGGRPPEDIPPPDEQMRMTEPPSEINPIAEGEIIQREGVQALARREDEWRQDGWFEKRPEDMPHDDDDDNDDDDDKEWWKEPRYWETYPEEWETWEEWPWGEEWPPFEEPVTESEPRQETPPESPTEPVTEPPPETIPPEPPTEPVTPEPPPSEEIPVQGEPVQPPPEIIEPDFTEQTEHSEQTETVPDTSPTEITETETSLETSTAETTASSSVQTETTSETEIIQTRETPPPLPDDGNQRNNDFRMEMRPNRWNVNVMLEHFALMADENGNFLGLRNTENYTDEQAEEIMSAILSTGKQQGMYGWLQYYKAQKEYGTLLVVTDKSSDQDLLNRLFLTTVIVGIIMLLVLFVFLIFFARWVVKPVRTALERQKQFVSDAGHELKTPLAVLTANADILQDEIGDNKWLGYMREQTDRMSQLVGDLLRLARMDNATQEYAMEEFDLSMAIEATALPFESQAFELRKNLEIDIQPGVTYYGSEQHIRQLAAIFIDNAMKYSNEHGTIKISLLQRGDNRILEFYNTGCEISPQETQKIFERFYRGDKARNTKGKNGYGLGLAIAKSIMEIHKIKIQVTCEQHSWIRFLMIM